MHKKFRKKRKINILHKGFILVSPNKKINIKLEEIYQNIYIYDTDRFCYVYLIDKNKVKKQIQSVRYDLKIGNDWITIIWFDNCHEGRLHQHILTELGSQYEISFPTNLKKNADLEYLIKWSKNNLEKNWLNYRRHFYNINKSKIKNLLDYL
ncbi:conserved hypothetical protein [Candidatus Roizmanbacteria bacterium]|nr:conserved hypothetical protein [Candidatus Roizmanbacteria bacterium]